MSKMYLVLSGILSLLTIGSESWAQSHVYETAQGSGTVVNIAMSTNSVTHVDSRSASRKLDKRFSIEVWNDDADDDIHCSFNVNVSTVVPTAATANAYYGRRIGPRTSITYAVPDAVEVYCLPSGTNGPTTVGAVAVITQLY